MSITEVSNIMAQLFTDFFAQMPTLPGEKKRLYPVKMSHSSSESDHMEFSESAPKTSLAVTSYQRRETEVEDGENTQGLIQAVFRVGDRFWASQKSAQNTRQVLFC